MKHLNGNRSCSEWLHYAIWRTIARQLPSGHIVPSRESVDFVTRPAQQSNTGIPLTWVSNSTYLFLELALDLEFVSFYFFWWGGGGSGVVHVSTQ